MLASVTQTQRNTDDVHDRPVLAYTSLEIKLVKDLDAPPAQVLEYTVLKPSPHVESETMVGQDRGLAVEQLECLSACTDAAHD
jgi:hypothetical protein